MSSSALWPLLDRFPGLSALPRLELRRAVTPVESLEAIAPGLWIKRDDLTALPIGGNKIRGLEFLLGGLQPDDRVATIGSRGSTHALATAIHARAHGASVVLGLWPQEMNPVASEVAAELERIADDRKLLPSAALAIPWLWWRKTRGDRAIPAGGTSPLGILGHVNAALELAEQVARRMLPLPKRVVVPLGSGGTAAGLSLGFGIAGMPVQIIAARVVPKIVGRRSRIMRLARGTAGLIQRHTEKSLRPVLAEVVVVENVYGGAYGRPLERATDAADSLRKAVALPLDATYAAKAFVSALDSGGSGDTLFWLTFDARWMTSGFPESPAGEKPDHAWRK